MSINVAVISGNLTRDPEARATASGTAVLSFSVAVNDRVQNRQTGQWGDRPNYIDCTLFGMRASSLAQILRKGMQVTVRGRLRWSQWQDRDTGKNRSKVEVLADDVQLPPRTAQQPQAFQPQPYQAQPPYAPQQAAQPIPAPPAQPAPPMQAPQAAEPSIYDEEIPF